MEVSINYLRKYFFHFLLWTIFVVSLAVDEFWLFDVSKISFGLYILGKTTVMLVLVYSNLIWLYPKFFKKKYYILYTICLITFTFLAGFLNTKLEFWIIEMRGLNGDWDNHFFVKQLIMALRYVLTAFLLQITVDFYEQKEKLKRIELEKTISELNFLKAQINPHFLFNTLNNLYALIIEKSDKSGECVLKLADILKYILAEGKEDKVSLKKELLLLENYIELEKLRKPDADVTFTNQCANENQQITPLLLLPFVENAFKHGLNTVSKNGFIHLTIKSKEKTFELSIENNIPPTSNAQAVESHGIGIENVKKRLELLYPNHYKLNIERKENSFLVNLHLQLS